MRRLLLLLAALTLPAPQAQSQAARGPESLEVVLSPGGLYFELENGGRGRFQEITGREVVFPVSAADYRRIRALLRPYQSTGLTCDTPPDGRPFGGYFVWRKDGREIRRPHQNPCYTPAYQRASRPLEAAWQTVRGWAEQREIPPPALPAPERMTLAWRSWGKLMREWTLTRAGEAVYVDGEGRTVSFATSAADFDRLREIFRPYEGVRFRCERAVTDGPYGALVWSQPGYADQVVGFDAGCTTGDADDLFERLNRAEAMMQALKDAS